MEILSFDVCGKLAHFRKYYANNTAFTYSMPPRTTVMGMLAAILGYSRDQYYERLASNRLRIGVRILQPVKKSFHRLNFLSIKSRGDALEGTGDFTGAGGHIQTPFEVVSGLHIGQDWVRYRLFVAPNEKDSEEFTLIKEAILQSKQHFNLTLGVACFSGWIETPILHEQIVESRAEGFVPLHSAVPSNKIEKLDFRKASNSVAGENYLEEELMPCDFASNNDRELSKLIRVLFSTEGKPYWAELNASFYTVPDHAGDNQNILFLE
ncbi:MAG: CRISPR-associated protein Cas5 [Saprospiraceae bacterium]